ncbi:hypothetical protein OCL90_13810, partial [Enterococcus faecalis]|nr:hypothetical protein [Enterococcus faecalis]
VSELTVSEVAVSELAVSEVAVSELAVSEVAISELAVSEAKTFVENKFPDIIKRTVLTHLIILSFILFTLS